MALARKTFDDLLEGIASDAPSPGSGAAAAAALALGIACLRKAVAISARHEPDDPAWDEADARLCGLLDQALGAADADAMGFPRLAAGRSASEKEEAAEDLVALADRFTWLCAQLDAEAEGLAPRMWPSMANDILAAQKLSEAACAIAKANGNENREAISGS
jgi:formiminotetrahydrofolate cyclodeaminase